MDAFQTTPGSTTGVPNVVYWIGLTSLLTDISAEMIASTLPVFLFSVLALSPLQVGFLDGVYHGITALVRVFAGYWADSRAGNRVVALTGYALSALARIAILVGASFGAIFALVGLLMDRLGKGIRTAPRDALIAAHTPAAQQGAAFGVHRTMDAVGAFVGPLLAAALLWWRPLGFEWLIAVSLGFALAGVLSFWWCVPNAPTKLRSEEEALHLVAQPSVRLSMFDALKIAVSDRVFLRILGIATLMSLFTISDGLIFASLQRAAAMEEHLVPLMFVGTAFVFLATAAPIGRVADRIGFLPTILTGYGLLALCYGVFAVGSVMGHSAPILSLGGTIILLGLHYAATDGVLVAFAVRVLPSNVRATGLALLTSAIAVARIGASTLYGYGWEKLTQPVTAALFAAAMTGCLVLAVISYLRGFFAARVEVLS